MTGQVTNAIRGTTDDPLPIDLAFQGGGSHGAFTWGVVERLLDDPTLKIESISGTSAGEHVTWVEEWADMRIHRITTPLLTKLRASSKMNAEWEFLTLLREEGNITTDAFLREHRRDLGIRATFDLDALLDNILEQI